MTSKIKNIIIFASIVVVLIFLYLFFVKGDGDEPALVSSFGEGMEGGVMEGGGSPITDEFLTLLLNVKSLSLESSIFSDPAFISLQDSSILLIPDGTEGRPNPFAPIGSDTIIPPVIPPALEQNLSPISSNEESTSPTVIPSL